MVYIIYALESYLLFCVGLFYFIMFSGDVVQCETSDRAIKLRESDVTYSQGVCGRIRLDEDLIKRRLISVEIKCA